MSKPRKTNPYQQVRPAIMLEAEELLDRLTVGTWIPNVDICETRDAVVVRIELPGIDPADIRLTIQDHVLRVQGAKREPAGARERLSYYCLERRYGKFDRRINIDWVVEAGRARAGMIDGILTVEIPRVEDRRGVLFEIPVSRKQK